MAEVYRLYTEAHYNNATKTTGAGQAQSWDTSRALGGLAGDIKLTKASSQTQMAYVTSPTFSLIGETRLTARFYIDAADYTIPTGRDSTIFHPMSASTTDTAYLVYVANLSGSPYIRVTSFADGFTSSNFGYIALPSGPHYIDIVLNRATSDVAGDASIYAYVDGVLGYTRENYDFYDTFPLVDRVRFGISSANDNNILGDLYLGKLLITNDANPIGPISTYDPSLFNTLRRRRRL